MKILGVSAFYHDSAAALVVDGEVVSAAQEERFTRKKQDAAFPDNAIEYCLNAGGANLCDMDAVVFYDKPFLKFERLLETYLAFTPRGYKSFAMAIPIWLKEKLFQKDVLRKAFMGFDENFDWQNKLLFSEHHMSHAASAFYPSPYEEAVVLTMDGVGEWATTSVAIGKGKDLKVVKEIHFPHSLGLLYSALTYYIGFKVNSGEYKVMGLAPYGEPIYADLILDKLVDLKGDGSFRLNQDYFDYCTGLTMTNAKFDDLFGGPPRQPDSELLVQKHMDIAASIQGVTETVMLKMTRALAAEFDIPNLCLAGGVALNCVGNGKVLRDRAFKNIWVQPAAGDAGGALGAAMYAHHLYFDQDRASRTTGKNGPNDTMQGGYLGPEYEQSDIETRLRDMGAKFDVLSSAEVTDAAAAALADEQAVGWMQGRMEFGPRALGARSIIGDPRSPSMQKTLNLKVKYRESFRPFAPSVLREDVGEWFDHEADSPYMLMVANVKKNHQREMTEAESALFGIEKLNIPRSNIPAVTHVDYSARIQTVHEDTNPKYHALIKRFKELTGCPIVVNTSFNVRGEPIVCTPEDAFRCFMGTELDVLVVGDCYLKKVDQDPAFKLDYKEAFELD
ncbi:MAG: carbamoyltransferase [Alphaproteobacteria bacterium]|nr:carbamoyltransferase [Alphaproteobacteria bacterium]